jgi:surfactin synthase thioesterase subunit
MTHVVNGSWLLRRPTRGRIRARLFCIPYAGVGASAYRLWSSGLPSELEVCPVQLPGRETRLREPALQRIDALVDALVPALLPHLDLPFAIFGHSMGAVLASEVTIALQQRGGPLPEHLFISGRRAPHIADPDPALGGLSDADFVAEINRRYGGIPAELLRDQEMMALLLPGLRADITALEAYAPGTLEPIACPLSVFGGTEDSRAPRAHLEAWREYAAGTFRVRMFPGDHFYLNPRRSELLMDISATLAASLQSAGTPGARTQEVAR